MLSLIFAISWVYGGVSGQKGCTHKGSCPSLLFQVVRDCVWGVSASKIQLAINIGYVFWVLVLVSIDSFRPGGNTRELVELNWSRRCGAGPEHDLGMPMGLRVHNAVRSHL